MPFGNSNYMDMNNKVGSYLNNDCYNTLDKENIILDKRILQMQVIQAIITYNEKDLLNYYNDS